MCMGFPEKAIHRETNFRTCYLEGVKYEKIMKIWKNKLIFLMNKVLSTIQT